MTSATKTDRLSIPLAASEGLKAIIDASDYECRLFCEFSDGFRWEGRICDRRWRAIHKSTVYGVCTIERGVRAYELRMHRLVMCARKGTIVDHIDGNGLHNYRTNLRFVSIAGNAQNRGANRLGTSKFKGVTWHRCTSKWECCIRHNGKKQHLGLFADEIKAAQAYDAKALELFGHTACLNFPTTAEVLGLVAVKKGGAK